MHDHVARLETLANCTLLKTFSYSVGVCLLLSWVKPNINFSAHCQAWGVRKTLNRESLWKCQNENDKDACYFEVDNSERENGYSDIGTTNQNFEAYSRRDGVSNIDATICKRCARVFLCRMFICFLRERKHSHYRFLFKRMHWGLGLACSGSSQTHWARNVSQWSVLHARSKDRWSSYNIFRLFKITCTVWNSWK